MKKLTNVILIGLMVCMIGGCSNKAEQKQLDDVTKKAEEYLENKYGSDFNVEDSYFIEAEGSMGSSHSENVLIKCDDGTTALYYKDEDKFVDDKQKYEISGKLSGVYNRLFQYLPGAVYVIAQGPVFNGYHGEGQVDGEYFHEFYDGDIQAYIQKENVSVSLNGNIFIIADQNNFAKQIETFSNNFYNSFSPNKHHQVSLITLSRDVYEQYGNGTIKMPNIGMNGVYAKVELKDKVNMQAQQYIHVGNGIYATCSENNFTLLPGDLTLKESISQDELLDKIGKEYTENYYVHFSTPIYNIEMSQRVKDFIKDGKLSLYIKYDSPKEERLYFYPDETTKYGHAFEEFDEMSNSGAKFETISEKDYFWIGKHAERLK